MDERYIKGRLVKIASIASYYPGNFEREVSCTLTISRRYVAGAGKFKSTKKYGQKKSWRLSGTCLLTAENFKKIFVYFASDVNPSVMFYSQDGGLQVIGQVIFTKVAFAGQGVGVVKMSFEAQGTGKPVVMTEE